MAATAPAWEPVARRWPRALGHRGSRTASKGTPAALGTAAALAATPAIWLTIPSLRIDLPLVAGIVATVAALFRPTPRRWLLAGLLAGVVILAKETTVLLVLLPLAWWGAIERRLWVGLAGRYATSALAVASRAAASPRDLLRP